jgi:hypothetical protein
MFFLISKENMMDSIFIVVCLFFLIPTSLFISFLSYAYSVNLISQKRYFKKIFD